MRCVAAGGINMVPFARLTVGNFVILGTDEDQLLRKL
jgi:hypothetical protein